MPVALAGAVDRHQREAGADQAGEDGVRVRSLEHAVAGRAQSGRRGRAAADEPALLRREARPAPRRAGTPPSPGRAAEARGGRRPQRADRPSVRDGERERRGPALGGAEQRVDVVAPEVRARRRAAASRPRRGSCASSPWRSSVTRPSARSRATGTGGSRARREGDRHVVGQLGGDGRQRVPGRSRCAGRGRRRARARRGRRRRPPSRRRPLAATVAQQAARVVVPGVQREPGERPRVARRPLLEQQRLAEARRRHDPDEPLRVRSRQRSDQARPGHSGAHRGPAFRAGEQLGANRPERGGCCRHGWRRSSRAGERARAQTGSLDAVFTGVRTPPAHVHAEWLGSLASRRRCTCGGDHVGSSASSRGQYSRSASVKVPAGAGSQFERRARSGDSRWT